MVSSKETYFQTKCGEIRERGSDILLSFCHLFSFLSHSLIASQPTFKQKKIFVGGWQVVSFDMGDFVVCCKFFLSLPFLFFAAGGIV